MDNIKRLIVLILLLLLVLLSGCKPVERIIENTKIEYVNRTDSFYQRDSIYVYQYQKNDTVYQLKYKEKIKYITTHDTLIARDTTRINTTKTITKQVVKYKNHLYAWQWGLMTIGIISIIFLIYFIYRKFR